jgi:hypothetical protein
MTANQANISNTPTGNIASDSQVQQTQNETKIGNLFNNSSTKPANIN